MASSTVLLGRALPGCTALRYSPSVSINLSETKHLSFTKRYQTNSMTTDIRMLCTAITTADQWFWSFLISRTTPYMITSLGYGTYMFFGALMIIMGFWALFFIPETKGK